MTSNRSATLVICLLIAFVFPMAVKPAFAEKTPILLVTIKPLHSLLASVTEGVVVPDLLLDGIASPHHFQLKPSSVKLIHRSDHLFWVGDRLESFLIRAVRGMADEKKALKLIDVPGLNLLPLREKGFHHHEHETVHGVSGGELQDNPESHKLEQLRDNHFWLDPVNASVLVGYFAQTLATTDPTNAEAYHSNAVAMQEQLQQLTGELQTLLLPVQDKSYLVFHDSFQYFENRFDLTSAGVVSVQPDGQPGAKRIRELQQLIKEESVQCLFSEPQFQSPSVRMLVADTDIRHAVIDPLGSQEPAGAKMYLNWLKNTAVTIKDCLDY